MDYQASGAYQRLPGLALGARAFYKRPVQDAWEDYSQAEKLGGQAGLGWHTTLSGSRLYLGISGGINDAEGILDTSWRSGDEFWSRTTTTSVSPPWITISTHQYTHTEERRTERDQWRAAVQCILDHGDLLSAVLTCEFSREYQEQTSLETYLYECRFDTGDPGSSYTEITTEESFYRSHGHPGPAYHFRVKWQADGKKRGFSLWRPGGRVDRAW